MLSEATVTLRRGFLRGFLFSRYFSGFVSRGNRATKRHPDATDKHNKEPTNPPAEDAVTVAEEAFQLSDHPVSLKPRLIHHVFRWGVGNAFRSHSKNRFRPTHAERNTAVCIAEDYFSCSHKFDHCKISYDKLNEQWEVLWIEFGKLNGKPFPVKKFGIEASKAESIAFAESLNKRLANQPKETHKQEPGVTFDDTLHCWVALSRDGSRPVARAFSAEYHGYNGAHKLATEFRNL